MSPYEQLLNLSRQVTDKSHERIAAYAKGKSMTERLIRSAKERVFNSRKVLDRKPELVVPFSWFKPTA